MGKHPSAYKAEALCIKGNFMKLLSALRQPAAMGTSLFAMAVIILGAVIITGHTGLPIASILANLAQPICACAIAVLVYLVIAEQRLEASV
jgi:hypothetical protein